MNTIKLYDQDAYLKEFTATVTGCEEASGKYKIILDKTAFFAEGGGQKSDTGYINNSPVFDVQNENGTIYHYTSTPFEIGANVLGKINFEERYRKMQIHTGEHIVSGVMHNMFGLDNIGFHLGTDEVTLDFNAILSREQLDAAEDAANEIIYKNCPVFCYEPDETELKNINYRSKKEITETVRIVEIKGHDICACCAPHVANTGEVGLIKLAHFEKIKGGTRITLLCATDALHDYREKFRNTALISALLCAKPNEIALAVENSLNEKQLLASQITELKRTIISLKAEAVTAGDKPIILIEDGLSIPDMRNLANELKLKRPLVIILSQVKESEYNFLFCGSNLTELFATFKNSFTLKGGGSDKMVQGTVFEGRKKLEEFLNGYIDKI